MAARAGRQIFIVEILQPTAQESFPGGLLLGEFMNALLRKAMNGGKQAGSSFLIVIVTLGLMEAVSSIVLSSKLLPTSSGTGVLLSRWPAQVRVNSELINRILVDRVIVERNPSDFFSFDFDPVLGFRRLEYLQWYTEDHASSNYAASEADAWWRDFAEAARGRFVIVTFGSSTTSSAQPYNWPRHIPGLARAHGATRDVIVLNAGHNGFMSMQQQIYASAWILPALERAGIKPDLAISLDGVGDIFFGVAGYVQHLRNRASTWYSRYNGEQQAFDASYRQLRTIDGAFANLLATLSTSAPARSVVATAARLVPYTIALALDYRDSQRRQGIAARFSPRVAPIFAYHAHNIIRVRGLYAALPWSLGPVDAEQAPAKPGVIVGRSLAEVVRLIDSPTSGAKTAPVQLDARDERDWKGIPELALPTDVRREIVSSFMDNITTFQSTFLGRGIDAATFLQPIVDERYYPYAARLQDKEIPNFNYALVAQWLQGVPLGGLYWFDADGLYQGAAEMFAQLDGRSPGHYFDIADLFRPLSRDVYTSDAIHYTTEGSWLIANDIVAQCIRTGRLPAAATPADRTAPGLASSLPMLLDEFGNYDLIALRGRALALPRTSGWRGLGGEQIEALPGLVSADSVDEVIAKLRHATPN